jgi:hypothetical protein
VKRRPPVIFLAFLGAAVTVVQDVFHTTRRSIMKPLTGSFLFLFICLPLAAGDADSKQAVKSQAQEMASAFAKGDYEKFVGYTHPKLVKLIGGQEKMIEVVKSSLAGMKSRGFTIQSYTVGDTTGMVAKGADRFAIVPATMIVNASGATVTTNSFLVGISEDGGKHWTFLDGAKATPQNIRILVPNYPEELKLPEKQRPVIEKTR